MELEVRKGEIALNRELTELDKQVLEVVKIIEKHTKYVVISGYIAILFGRTRGTEDVDVFIERLGFEAFSRMFDDLISHGMWCINGRNKKSMYELLEENLAIRFAKEKTVIPNFEIKFVKDLNSKYSLEHRIKVKLNGKEIWTSELEMQIPYKIYLGSDKDLEDALHLYLLFEKFLDKQKMKELAKVLKVNLGVLHERL